MNRQARVLFNFISSSRIDNYSALQETSAQHSHYQRLIYSLLLRSIHTTEDFDLLGRQLASIAQYAYLIRNIETIDQISRLMLTLPISSGLKGIAPYYQAICAKRKGHFDDARRLLEGVGENAISQYKARALLTIGATYFDNGEVEAALPLYLAAEKLSREIDLLTLLESQRNIAAIRSIHGDHKQALKDIENLFPLVRVIAKRYPMLYYSFLNSFAVELGEVGRLNEARHVCQLTLASPFAQAYPEWLETRDELESKHTDATPSIVAVSARLPKSRKFKPALSFAITRESLFFQRPVTIVCAAFTAIEIITCILDRVRHSIHTRGPPACF